MKKIVFLLLPFILICCNRDQVLSDKTEMPAPSQIKNADLLNAYSDICFDSLDVHASYDAENKSFKYLGKKLDSLSVTIIDKSATAFSQSEGYFACFKFTFTDSLICLVTRTPSYYSSTAVKVFVYNKKTSTIIKTIDGADVFGDAGASSQFSTRIILSDKLLFLTYGYSSFDRSVEDEKDTVVEKSNFFFLTQYSNGRLDTISKDSATIVSKFPAAVKKLASY